MWEVGGGLQGWWGGWDKEAGDRRWESEGEMTKP